MRMNEILERSAGGEADEQINALMVTKLLIAAATLRHLVCVRACVYVLVLVFVPGFMFTLFWFQLWK